MFSPDSGNLSISDTLFVGHDNHALQVHSMDASIAIESTNVTAIGPKAKLMESQILPSQSAAVQISGLRLRVTLRDSLIYENSHAGLFFKSVAGSEIELSNVVLRRNGNHGMSSEGAHHNVFTISGSTFLSNHMNGICISGVGNSILTNWNDAPRRRRFHAMFFLV